MPIWVGIDDTDSPEGGCTTHALTELVAVARTFGLDVLGEPRLVRLNPNVPWKTRGNAALAARFGLGSGPRRRIGEIDHRPVWSYSAGRSPSEGARSRFLDAAWDRLRAVSRIGAPGTDPALVSVPSPLPHELYWEAVRTIVDVDRVRRLLWSRGAYVRTVADDRGLVGAAAAIAWPGRRRTWELIAYRSPERERRPRRVSVASVRRAQERERGLFLCEDSRTRRLLVTPHTPCPILYGLRGTRPDAPLRARRTVRSEPVDRWILYRTNQGTGDHLLPRTVRTFGPYEAGWVAGTVDGEPEELRGGHVRLVLRDDTGARLRAVAFEPTKTLPAVARALRPGDRVRLWGSRSVDPTLRLEGIRLVRLSPRRTPGAPPRCPTCGGRTHSLGSNRGYRCERCRSRVPPEVRRWSDAPTPLRPGTYHPTPSARRHLAPLSPDR